ncbi:XrtB/PEP-CTERM-associated polysaccharide biosynthesis outer membrane protein EpsL [Rugamonas sp.]|uniref:XrtB/PEP-CTERM-associated polysaccharide biosynthesis outer membrane protein EpsL n=1 Tax=Rugamonas sp. TaxID=1926287 RepID=UPI0025D78165|nr:XrtB/PEP-CTERM-associated polysaccharide biosynthesis outer membrane protein EpsL [Rugamonas sp.]
MTGHRRAPGKAGRNTVLAALMGLVFSAPAMAALSDTIHPFVGVSYSYDDNLLRLPDSRTGDNAGYSDTSKQVVAGLDFERPVGQQQFSVTAKVSKVTFDRFDELNYTGKDATANWQWRLGKHFDGTLGGTYSQTLTPFTDFHSSQLNLRTQTGEYVTANWLFHPSWRARTRYEQNKFNYDLTSQSYLDRTEKIEEVGFDYLAASGSTVGLLVRQTKGDYENPLFFGNELFDESFKQDELKLKVLWKLGAVTQLQFEAGHARRTHESANVRDASGTNGRAIATWSPKATLQFTGTLYREFSAFEGSLATYSLNKGASVAATWSATEKIRVDAQYLVVRRDYPGLEQSALLGAYDHNHTSSLGATYTARSNISLGLNVYRDVRSVSPAFSNAYRANGVSFNANVQF